MLTDTAKIGAVLIINYLWNIRGTYDGGTLLSRGTRSVQTQARSCTMEPQEYLFTLPNKSYKKTKLCGGQRYLFQFESRAHVKAVMSTQVIRKSSNEEEKYRKKNWLSSELKW